MASLSSVSDRIGSLMRPLKRLWEAAHHVEITPRKDPPFAAGEVVDLDRILILLARTPGGTGEPVRLMTNRMSVREVHFLSKGGVEPGADLNLQLLLEPGFSLQVKACVAEASRVDGECRGRLELFCGPFERGALTSYLIKRNAHPSLS